MKSLDEVLGYRVSSTVISKIEHEISPSAAAWDKPYEKAMIAYRRMLTFLYRAAQGKMIVVEDDILNSAWLYFNRYQNRGAKNESDYFKFCESYLDSRIYRFEKYGEKGVFIYIPLSAALEKTLYPSDVFTSTIKSQNTGTLGLSNLGVCLG